MADQSVIFMGGITYCANINKQGNVFINIVAGVTKMGNIVPRAAIEPTFLAFQANVLSITPCRFP